MRGVNILTTKDVQNIALMSHIEIYPGKWVPRRPEGSSSFKFKIKAAWLVFTGRADALIWFGGQ